MSGPSPYPRKSCPNCGHLLASDATRCPNCGRILNARPLSNGCLIAMLIVFGYPLLAFGCCMVLVVSSPTGSGGPELVMALLVPALLLAAISYYIAKNRNPGVEP